MVSRLDIIEQCKKHLGETESPPDSNICPASQWYGVIGAWCAMIVSKVFYDAFLPNPSPLSGIESKKGFCYCPSGVAYFKKQNKLINPKDMNIANIVFFDFSGKKTIAQHVGISASKVDANGYFTCYEGNTSPTDKHSQDNGGSYVLKQRHISMVSYVANITELTDNPAKPVITYPKWPGVSFTLTSPHTAKDTIKTWKLQMIKKGYKLTENGEFDQATYDALKDLQKKHGLTVDGILGNSSWNMTWESS